jgi:uncharacterized protein (DUF1501 family)
LETGFLSNQKPGFQGRNRVGAHKETYMLNRRQFVSRMLRGSSLLALGPAVPGFLAETAFAAEAGKDTILVVIELSGGNDGLNTVIPYADDLYHKARPTLRFTKEQVVRVDDHVGLHPGMRSFGQLLQQGQLAVVQGVGYPNPDRSHFESMDVWQSADPKRRSSTGWIARSVPDLQDRRGNVPVMQIGPDRLPLALSGAPGGVVTINEKQPYRLDLGKDDPARQKARRRLLEDLSRSSDPASTSDLLKFVQRREVQTYTTLDKLQQVLQGPGQQGFQFQFNSLLQKMQMIGRLIQQGFGTRVFYVNLDGFDTHAMQAQRHQELLQQLADSVTQFFNELKRSGHDKRVLVMTFSEFGRRVQENGSKGTDHGAAACLFVAGPAVRGGAVGKHPSLKDLDSGDLRYHTDFRQVYATLLDGWLGCDSRAVLGESFKHVELLKTQA